MKKFLIIVLLFAHLLGKYDTLNIYIDKVDTKKQTAIIGIGNLSIGQSGIVVHKYKDNNFDILSSGYIIDSNSTHSTIKLDSFDDLKQDALPISNLKTKAKDIFVLNFLYRNATIIAPNHDAFIKVRDSFSKVNFIHPDIFASYLKLENAPAPSKNDMMIFAKKNNIGIFYFYIQNKIYMVDMRTFKVIDNYELKANDEADISPFYTRIEGIKRSLFDFGAKKVENYSLYYKKLLNLE